MSQHQHLYHLNDQIDSHSCDTNTRNRSHSENCNPSNNSILISPLHLSDENKMSSPLSNSSTTIHPCTSSNSTSIHRRRRRTQFQSFPFTHPLVATTTTALLALVSFCQLSNTANAIAFHNQPSSQSQAQTRSTSSSSSTSSNALALLNTARLLREQNQYQGESGGNQSQSQHQELSIHALPDLLRRSSNNNKQQKKKMKQTKTKTQQQYYALFDEDTTTSTSSTTSNTNNSINRNTDDQLLSHAILNRENEFISHRVEKQLPDVKSLLQTSYGNDVPDVELLLQMEAARARGKDCSSVAALAFMDLHHDIGFASSGAGTSDGSTDDVSIVKNSNDKSVQRNRKAQERVEALANASSASVPRAASGTVTVTKRSGNTGSTASRSAVSTIEKVAMSSLPSQLPGLAAPVLNGNIGGSSRNRARAVTKIAATTAIKRMRTKGTNIKLSSTARISSTKKTITNENKKKTTPILRNLESSSTSSSSSQMKKISTKKVSNIMTARKTLSQSFPSSSSSTTSTTDRVSHDEEIALARIIQRGAELHSIKNKFESEHHRDITRQEWTELAELDSPKELRRMVSLYRKAKNKLVMANMGLVHAVVRTRMRESGQGSVSFSGISYEEMVQEGSLGLLRAAELFDPTRGLRFSTYATIWIKGVLGNSSVCETITLPLREKNKWNKIQQAREEISLNKAVDENGADYQPSEKEIGNHCGLSATEIKNIMSKMKRAKNVLSLDYQYASQSRSGTESDKYDALANDKNLMDDVDLFQKLQLRADIIAAMARNLDPREARLMRLRYGLNDGKTRSIRDCAEAMGISKARAQQLAVGCLKKLREADDAESLQEYLLSVA